MYLFLGDVLSLSLSLSVSVSLARSHADIAETNAIKMSLQE